MVDDDAQEMPPWLPTFKVGDRVRVRLSGECLLVVDGRPYPHAAWHDGIVGVITRDDMPSLRSGHRFVVLADGTAGRKLIACAQELELLTADDVDPDTVAMPYPLRDLVVLNAYRESDTRR